MKPNLQIIFAGLSSLSKYSPVRMDMRCSLLTSVFIIVLLTLISCSNENTPLPDSPTEIKILSTRSSATSDFIDVETAAYAAYKVMNAPVNGVEVSSPKTVSHTVPIINKEGVTVMYAVNFDNGGYVILSASRKATPVIASSDRGSYNLSLTSSPFVRRLIERSTGYITEALSYPEDSLSVHAGSWAALLPPVTSAPLRLKSASEDNYYTIIETAKDAWMNQGYEVYDAQAWLRNEEQAGGWYMYLPYLDQLLRNVAIPVNWADGRLASELSFILVRHIYIYTRPEGQCSPITTSWSTGYPYNSAVPGGMQLSSEAVAVGQILHYFNHPVINNYSASSSNPLQNNTEIANFLYDVAVNAGTVFGSSYSYSSYANVGNALSGTYNYSFQSGDFDGNGLISSIRNGSPGIVIEYYEDGSSHAWICDGYRIASHRVDYFLMSPLGQPIDIQYGYECVGQWDQYGNSNYQYENSSDYIYFDPFYELNPNHTDTWFGSNPPKHYHSFLR